LTPASPVFAPTALRTSPQIGGWATYPAGDVNFLNIRLLVVPMATAAANGECGVPCGA